MSTKKLFNALLLFYVFAILNTKLQFSQRNFGNETVLRIDFVEFGFEIKETLHVKNTHIGKK
jgi:hypothetical protein